MVTHRQSKAPVAEAGAVVADHYSPPPTMLSWANVGEKAPAEALFGAAAGSAVSGDKNEKPEKRSQSLLASMRQAKDSGPFDPPPLKSFRSVPPQVPTGGSPKGMEQQDSLAAGRIRSLGRQHKQSFPGPSLDSFWRAVSGYCLTRLACSSEVADARTAPRLTCSFIQGHLLEGPHGAV